MKNIIIILLGVAFLTSCGTNNTNSKSGINTIVLIDISNSIQPEVLDWYLQTIENDIFTHLTQFDKIKILPIDGASQTASKVLLDLDFFEYRAEWDKMGLNANESDRLEKEAFTNFIHSKMEELKRTIVNAKILRQNQGNATDIIGAIEVAQEKLDKNFNNSIIIMSDMEQYADQCKMYADDDAKNWLSQISEIRLVNIDQFSIAIITGEQINMSKPYYNEIKSFWKEFFVSQGVKTISYLGADATQLKQLYFANN